MDVSFLKQRKVGSCRVENTETKVEKQSARLPCVVLQRYKCADIHHSGERASSGLAKDATESSANWSHEGLTTEGKVKKIPSSGNWNCKCECEYLFVPAAFNQLKCWILFVPAAFNQLKCWTLFVPAAFNQPKCWLLFVPAAFNQPKCWALFVPAAFNQLKCWVFYSRCTQLNRSDVCRHNLVRSVHLIFTKGLKCLCVYSLWLSWLLVAPFCQFLSLILE